VNYVRMAKIRAVIGIVFALLGIGIGVQVLLRPEAFSAKLWGLLFSALLVGLGAVRVRMYLKLKNTTAP